METQMDLFELLQMMTGAPERLHGSADAKRSQREMPERKHRAPYYIARMKMTGIVILPARLLWMLRCRWNAWTMLLETK